ncbi:putative flap endonuclease-1-like 5' DNA nuclease [Neolewinella xylanilytica]|uniref:Putative flap endonuclease-1-like 5' DNA nuclease n=1 Tax=Neolewinella xylanilytica TaxID=1514080 RepID=A0A2S6I3T7_9BACT|nr:helix-hairpin-helix domain-containing protein [Neolewinella xylanilytica]PPK85719.1 putative flap endonuclease-1-like 5' DNA nuclease [Neolewinella xylanilytica]
MIKSNYVKSKNQYKVSFEIPQERVGENRDVRVLGTFNDWSWEEGLQLKNGKKAYTGTTELPAGHYQFRYLIDGHHWANDDSAEAYTDSGHGSENCCFSLEQVAEGEQSGKAPAAKKPTAKKGTAKKSDAIQAANSAPATKPVVTPKKAPAKKTTAKKATTKKASTAQGDDLKKIEGIGPKIAGLLNEAGIMTYSDLAKAKENLLADVLQKAGARFRLAKHDTWQEQAKLAAAGKTEELKKMQDELKGGRK